LGQGARRGEAGCLEMNWGNLGIAGLNALPVRGATQQINAPNQKKIK